MSMIRRPPPIATGGGGSRIQPNNNSSFIKKPQPQPQPPPSPSHTDDGESVDENMLDDDGAIPDVSSTSEGVTPRVPDATSDPMPSIPDIEDDDPEDDMGDPLDSARGRERDRERQREKEKEKQQREKEKEKERERAKAAREREKERERERETSSSGSSIIRKKMSNSGTKRIDSTRSSKGSNGEQHDKGESKGSHSSHGSSSSKGKGKSDKGGGGGGGGGDDDDEGKGKRRKGSFMRRKNDNTTTPTLPQLSTSQSLRTGAGASSDTLDSDRRNTIAGYKPDDKRRGRGSDIVADDDADEGDINKALQRRYTSQDIFDYHVLSVEALQARLRTSIDNGLSTADAEQKLGRNGPNHPSVKSPTLDIDEFATRKVLVRRDGYRKAIESKDLVVGDVVSLETGPVFADMRVVAVNTTDMLVDNSMITGDPEPIPRSVDMTTENYLTSENLIFYGTSIVDGEGTGIVVRTGDGTLLARMIKDSESAKFRKEGGPKAKKAIMKQLAKNGLLFKEPNAASRLGRVTTLVVDAVGVITENKSSVSYIMIDKEIREATSALPEGEPTYNALQRACVLSCNAFFQVPEGVNKTKLSIDSVDVEEWDNTSGALLRFYEKNPTLGMKRRENAFCSEIMRTAWEKVADDLNDAHVSIHRWAKGPGLGGEDETKAGFLAVLTGPLEVVLQHCTTHMVAGNSKKLDHTAKKEIRAHAMTLNGYGEVVVALAQLPLNSSDYSSDFEFDFYSPNFPLKEMCFLGLISMGSRFYRTIPAAIERCKLANIRVIMVSQDPSTAVKVMARKIGLITKETPEDIAKREGVLVDEMSPELAAQAKAIVLDGAQMALMMEEGLSHIMRTHDEVVIAGTDASQKLKIVRAAQLMRKEEVVVATGAQLGDCVGLTVADVGIAAPGSVEGVQQAADAIMTGGALDSILDAVEFVRKKGESGGCTLQ